MYNIAHKSINNFLKIAKEMDRCCYVLVVSIWEEITEYGSNFF